MFLGTEEGLNPKRILENRPPFLARPTGGRVRAGIRGDSEKVLPHPAPLQAEGKASALRPTRGHNEPSWG
eukprot:7335556-Alexandrium_andersonii.AAC.1